MGNIITGEPIEESLLLDLGVFMDPEQQQFLTQTRAKLGIPEPGIALKESWLAAARVGVELSQAWFWESSSYFYDSEWREKFMLDLAKNDSGPDAALIRIARVLDTTGAWRGELLEPALVLKAAARLRGKDTQRRWIDAMRRLCDPAEPVDEVTRGVALKGLLLTDKWSSVEGISPLGPYISDCGIRLEHLRDLSLSDQMMEQLLGCCPELDAEASMARRAAQSESLVEVPAAHAPEPRGLLARAFRQMRG